MGATLKDIMDAAERAQDMAVKLRNKSESWRSRWAGFDYQQELINRAEQWERTADMLLETVKARVSNDAT